MPKPRRTTASCVPPTLLVWAMPLTLRRASSSEITRWSRSTPAETTAMLAGVSRIAVSAPAPKVERLGW